MKKIFIIFILLPLSLLLSQSNSEKPFPFTKIGSNLYKIEVDVNSIIASIGPDGILLCDVGGESKGLRVMATVRELGGEKIDYIIDTHWHVDHTGGNICFGKEAIIIAHENVRKRLSEDKYLKFWDEEHPAFPEYALPDIVFTDRMTMHFNGEDIEIIHLPGGHTDSDAIVYFRKSNILHIGDCLFSNGFPAIDFEMGGSVEGLADNLNKIASMMPLDVRIIVGHGPDYTIEKLLSYEKMVRSSLDAVRSAMQKDMSVEEMQKNNLIMEWEDYSHGFFSCDEWINMIYQSLIYQSNHSSKNSKQWPELIGPYLGQKPPGMTSEVFAPDVVSTNDLMEMGCTWTPDGREFYFGRSETSDISSNWAIWGMREKDGVWSEPQMVAFSGVYRDFAPFITPDGKYMIFYRMSSQKNETRQGSRIVERTGNAWGEPRFFVDAYCLTTEDFRIFYFSTEPSEETSRDIGQMTLDKGVFSESTKLEGELNSEEWEAHGSISHDGSFMLFDRAESTFVSFRKDDGTWSRGYDLGSKFHIPSVSPDGKYMFFESNGDIYWVDAKIIEDIKQKELK